jgi:glycosyltransferase involved in cell wall biosynthesis
MSGEQLVNKSCPSPSKTNDLPTFSVIIATFNRAHLLPRSIQSVLNQTFPHFELIIVDDGSTDHTRAVVEQIRDSRMRYVYQKNKGRSTARNAGVDLAKGQYVTFLDSDDEALPAWLEHFSQILQKPNIGIVCAGCVIIEKNRQKRTVLPEDLGGAFNHQVGLFLAGSFVLRRELFMVVGGYVESLDFSENTELALRLVWYCAQNGWQIMSLTIPLMAYYGFSSESEDTLSALKARLDSTKYILTHHNDKLQQDYRDYSIWSALAGVNAARLGRYREARYFFWTALRAYPWYWKNYVRFLLTLMPPLSQMIWAGKLKAVE